MLIQGWPAITEALEQQFLAALQTQTRRIVALDPSFELWPLSSPALLQALQDWGRLGHRRLELAAPDWQAAARRHPRFLRWRQHFDHLLDLREFVAEDFGGAGWPCALFAAQDGMSLRVIEFEAGRAVLSDSPLERQKALEQFDAIAQRSGSGWPLSTLGL